MNQTISPSQAGPMTNIPRQPSADESRVLSRIGQAAGRIGGARHAKEDGAALPSQADLDAVAEEERVRQAAGGESPVASLIDAAMQLAVGRIYLDPHTTAPDHLATAFCSECFVRAEAFDRLEHAPYCLVGQIFAAVESLEGGSRLVTVRNERHVELFPVEHPTATELA